MVTAGVTWQAEIGPSVYAIVISTRPNASAVATTPAAVLDPAKPKPKERVATPTAKKTSTAVPAASATSLRVSMPYMSPPPPPAIGGQRPAGTHEAGACARR